MTDGLIIEMKKRIKTHPVLKKYVEHGVREYGLTEDEAMDIMIKTWANMRVKEEVLSQKAFIELMEELSE